MQNNEKMLTLIILRHFLLFFRQFTFSFFAGAHQQQSDAFSFQTYRCSAEQINNFPRQWQFYRRKYNFFQIFSVPSWFYYTVQVKWNGQKRENILFWKVKGNPDKVKNDDISLLLHLLFILWPIFLILAVTLTLNLNTPGSGSRQSMNDDTSLPF